MWMTPGEICREYRQAKKKAAQVGILADLNSCSKAEIRDILQRHGIQARVANKAANDTWTEEEERLCKQLTEQGLYPAEIAKQIPKHDRRAVARKMRALKCW